MLSGDRSILGNQGDESCSTSALAAAPHASPSGRIALVSKFPSQNPLKRRTGSSLESAFCLAHSVHQVLTRVTRRYHSRSSAPKKPRHAVPDVPTHCVPGMVPCETLPTVHIPPLRSDCFPKECVDSLGAPAPDDRAPPESARSRKATDLALSHRCGTARPSARASRHNWQRVLHLPVPERARDQNIAAAPRGALPPPALPGMVRTPPAASAIATQAGKSEELLASPQCPS